MGLLVHPWEVPGSHFLFVGYSLSSCFQRNQARCSPSRHWSAFWLCPELATLANEILPVRAVQKVVNQNHVILSAGWVDGIDLGRAPAERL